MGSIRLAVVDDHPLMRDGIVLTLSREPDFEVVASGGSASDAVRIADGFQPDIMLLDLKMPGGGILGAKTVAERHPQILLLFLTVSEQQEDVTAALAAGVRGYILKGISGPDLVRAIRNVLSGETYVTPEFAARLLASPLQRTVSVDAPAPSLSVREEQILRAVSRGLTNKEVARTLDLSEKTVKHYMSSVLNKLGARNRVEAVMASSQMKGRSG